MVQSRSGKVAAFFAENASLTVNERTADSGSGNRARIHADFPDMTVTFDKLEPRADRTAFHWTLTGTYAGTGKHDSDQRLRAVED